MRVLAKKSARQRKAGIQRPGAAVSSMHEVLLRSDLWREPAFLRAGYVDLARGNGIMPCRFPLRAQTIETTSLAHCLG